MAYEEYELRIYGVPAMLLSMYHVCVTYVRRIRPATYVPRIFKCTQENVAPRRMRSLSYVFSRMYVRVTYLSYLDKP